MSVTDECRGDAAWAQDSLKDLYGELRRIAALQMSRHCPGATLQPTALVHEAWLRLVKEDGRTWRNRAHFFRAAALAMRRILEDRARHKLSLKRGAGGVRVPLPIRAVTGGLVPSLSRDGRRRVHVFEDQGSLRAGDGA